MIAEKYLKRAPSKAEWRAHLQRARPGATYVVGNSVAILIGFAIARFTLLQANHISWVTIRTGDWMAYYAGAHLVALGHGAQIFNNAVVQRLQMGIFYPFVVPKDTVLPYIYHPYWAIVLAPVGALNYEASFDTFFIINVAALATVLLLMERYIGLQGWPAVLLRFSAWSSLPVLLCLINGQSSIFILLFVALSFFALRSNRPELAGVALALAAIKPPYVIPFILVFVVLREWRAVAACVAASVTLLVIPMVVMGRNIDFNFVHSALSMNVTATPGYWFTNRNASIFALADSWFARPASVLVAGAASVAVLGVLTLFTHRSRSLDLSLALATVAGVLVNPHVLLHDVVLLLLPVAVLIRHLQPVPARAYLGLGAGFLAVYVGYFWSSSLPIRLLPITVLALGAGLLVVSRNTVETIHEPDAQPTDFWASPNPADSTMAG